MEEIQVGALIRPGEQEGDTIETDHFDYKVIQKALGGDCTFEYAYFNKDVEDMGIDICVDEEGKIKELPPTAIIFGYSGEIVDVIAGPILFISHDKEGNSVGLNFIQKDFITNTLCEFSTLINKESGEEYKVLMIRQ